MHPLRLCALLTSLALLQAACADDASPGAGNPPPDAGPDIGAASPDVAPDPPADDNTPLSPDTADPGDGNAEPDGAPVSDAADDAADDAVVDAEAPPGEPDGWREEQDAPPPPWPPARDGCNGHVELCDRPYPEVVFPGTHNSMSNADDGWGVPNQTHNLRRQLSDGIRVFLLDVYEEEEEVLLCHAFCIIGSRPLREAMEEFADFLEQNPREVVSIKFEDYISADRLAGVLREAGLERWVYTHDADAGWPTLGAMIEADTRLVVTAQNEGPPPAWLHNVWDLAWDTPFSFASTDEFNCRWNRGDRSNDILLINHWVLSPLAMPSNAVRANARTMLESRVETCRAQWDRLPTWIAVDFYEIGDIFAVVDALNGVASAAR
jgi:hypothetical protein